ncbi:hypothetical protein F0U62_01415 [Cystobacter fuscus]|nr:hypothetical protein F0U62_01415 [Cystobacter fuscus]
MWAPVSTRAAGIDFGLVLLAQLRGEDAAKRTHHGRRPAAGDRWFLRAHVGLRPRLRAAVKG